jgi:hypothetical protein
MRFLSIILLLALSLCIATHAHCLVEDCSNLESRADDPLCLDGQSCANDEARRTSASVTLKEPVVIEDEAVPVEASSDPRPPCLSLATKDAPALEQLQTFLI